MLKPASLRRAIETALPDIAANPDRLILYIDQGSIEHRAGASLSFEYRYRLNVILTDYAGHASAAVVPMLAWLRTNQPEIALNPELGERALAFEAEILTHNTTDLAFQLLLTERVIVTEDTTTGAITAQHVGEPSLDERDIDWALVFVKPESAPGWTGLDPAPV